MNWLERYYEKDFLEKLPPGKVLLIYGARRTGKTSLVANSLKKFSGKFFSGVGEDADLSLIFSKQTVAGLKSAFSGYDLLFFDEAQRLPNVGIVLKILADHFPSTKIIASGSSSFELSSQVGEPLTGRHTKLLLYPISVLELKEQFGGMYVIQNLENLLIYGSYPECLKMENIQDKREYLFSLRNSYLFKDILEMENLKNADKLSDLLRLLAFQIGKEVSLSELGSMIGISKQTVEKYLDLLEKSFVIKKVRGFSRNLRNEITKTCRYYFLDNGIRNSIISNFNSLENRDDIGMLWENFLFTERMKKLEYTKAFSNIYFWRTHDKKEIDLVEERDGNLYGFEFKWKNQKQKVPKLWLDTYSNASLEFITKENFLEFIG
ncbi:MAG: ATP-binding protein [Leptospiraceae bacterium]|nr:ATP-binding protein [Leptospiraceae bacterium]